MKTETTNTGHTGVTDPVGHMKFAGQRAVHDEEVRPEVAPYVPCEATRNETERNRAELNG